MSLYIAFEGIDGSGKTTLSKWLINYLEKEGFKPKYVKEPWLDEIQKVLYEHDVDPLAEVFLFAADRIILQKEVVLPTLKEERIIISDRSFYGSLAYQGAKKIEDEFIKEMNQQSIKPDIVFLLDLPPEKALNQIKGRKRTRFEKKSYLERVRKRYLSIAKSEETSKFFVINAEQSKREIMEKIKGIINEELYKI